MFLKKMLNVKLCSQRHIQNQVEHLRLSSSSLHLNHMLKMYLIREKTYNCENSRRKSVLLTMEQFDFSKFEILQWNGIINKEGFLNQHLLQVLKLLVFVLFSFFINLNIMFKTIFSRAMVLYLIAKVERKKINSLFKT